mmetsp:Transcript_2075/g.6731  ORF Transcript_2075/g.6731 Transcript_2075/m.6731 type:complete len:404 (-) Transcript_2075:932-2143(-)
MMNGTRCSLSRMTMAFSMDSSSAGRPAALNVRSSDSDDMSRLKSKPPTPHRSCHECTMVLRTSSLDLARYVTKPAASRMCVGSDLICFARSSHVVSHRPFSPLSLPSRFSARSSVSSVFLSPIFRLSASAVRRENSSFMRATLSSSSRSSFSSFSILPCTARSVATALPSSFSSGSILVITSEYRMLALTHAAIGAAACDTRWMVLASNDDDLAFRILLTFLRMSAVMRRASKARMSSLTPRLPRNFFIDSHDVSSTPSSIRTADSTSAMGSGGIFSDRISLRWSDLMLPTASFAFSRIGAMPLSCSSMSAFCAVVSRSATAASLDSSSTSLRRSDASASACVMLVMASLAAFCFSPSSTCCSPASRESWSTVCAALWSLPRPALRRSMSASTLPVLLSYRWR